MHLMVSANGQTDYSTERYSSPSQTQNLIRMPMCQIIGQNHQDNRETVDSRLFYTIISIYIITYITIKISGISRSR